MDSDLLHSEAVQPLGKLGGSQARFDGSEAVGIPGQSFYDHRNIVATIREFEQLPGFGFGAFEICREVHEGNRARAGRWTRRKARPGWRPWGIRELIGPEIKCRSTQ